MTLFLFPCCNTGKSGLDSDLGIPLETQTRFSSSPNKRVRVYLELTLRKGSMIIISFISCFFSESEDRNHYTSSSSAITL